MRKAREGGRESFRGGTKYLCSIWGTYHFQQYCASSKQKDIVINKCTVCNSRCRASFAVSQSVSQYIWGSSHHREFCTEELTSVLFFSNSEMTALISLTFPSICQKKTKQVLIKCNIVIVTVLSFFFQRVMSRRFLVMSLIRKFTGNL